MLAVFLIDVVDGIGNWRGATKMGGGGPSRATSSLDTIFMRSQCSFEVSSIGLAARAAAEKSMKMAPEAMGAGERGVEQWAAM